MSNEHDLRLMYKRIFYTLLVFLSIIAIHYYTREINGAGILDGISKETVQDTIYARSNDAVMSKIIISYNIEIDPHQRNDYNKHLSEKGKDYYYDMAFRLLVKEALRTEIQKKIRFDQENVLHDYRVLVVETIKQNMKQLPETGITLQSFQLEILHEERVLQLLTK